MPGKQPAAATPSSRLDGDPADVGSAAPAPPLLAARGAARLGALGFVLAGDAPASEPAPAVARQRAQALDAPAGATVQVQDGAQVVPG